MPEYERPDPQLASMTPLAETTSLTLDGAGGITPVALAVPTPERLTTVDSAAVVRRSESATRRCQNPVRTVCNFE